MCYTYANKGVYSAKSNVSYTLRRPPPNRIPPMSHFQYTPIFLGKIKVWFSALIPLLSGLFGENGPLGQYFKIKADTIKAQQEYQLAILKAQTETALATVQADATTTTNRLSSTSQSFKEFTFWFLCGPVLLTMFFPSYAVPMWANFKLIPDWFQILFVSVYSSIWGLPIAKEYLGGMFSSLGNAINDHRDYKLAKARINRESVMASLRAKLFPRGMNQQQVDIVDGALDAGEKDS